MVAPLTSKETVVDPHFTPIFHLAFHVTRNLPQPEAFQLETPIMRLVV